MLSGYSSSFSGVAGYGGLSDPIDPVPPIDDGVAKYAPSATRPIIIFWKHLSQIAAGSAIWTDKSTWVEANPSFQDFYTVAGFTKPSTAYYRANQGSGANFNSNNASDLLDCSDANLQAKIDAHAASDAQHIADCLFKQGLLRGAGPIGGGNYGGSWNHHELYSAGGFLDASADYRFTALLGHPTDAAAINRTQTLATGPSTTREVTLPKLSPNGSYGPFDIQTAAGRAANEAATNGYRPATYQSLVATHGIAAAKRYIDALILAVKAKCDSYTIPAGQPGAGGTVQLCYPAYVHFSWEDQSYSARFNSQSFINAADAPAEGQGYYHLGVLWHVRGNISSPSPQWTTTLYYEKDGSGNFTVPRSYLTALQNTDGLHAYASSYTPALGVSLNPTSDQKLSMLAIEFATVAHAIHKSTREPWQVQFPETKFSNYDFVVVADPAEPYQRVGGAGALRSIQQTLQLDAQAPSLYGNYADTAEILAAVGDSAIAAAVTAWNLRYFDQCVAILDALDPSLPIDPYIWGVNTAAQLRAGTVNPAGQWGGDAKFFKNMVKALYARGLYKYIVFAGDPELTYAAWKEAQADIANGNLSITW